MDGGILNGRRRVSSSHRTRSSLGRDRERIDGEDANAMDRTIKVVPKVGNVVIRSTHIYVPMRQQDPVDDQFKAFLVEI